MQALPRFAMACIIENISRKQPQKWLQCSENNNKTSTLSRSQFRRSIMFERVISISPPKMEITALFSARYFHLRSPTLHHYVRSHAQKLLAIGFRARYGGDGWAWRHALADIG